ncbi:uncharacterized protein N7506_011543 [Penicillium brevicompactum]|uniref:uncharacterized protein n=1 Tax=Penicillium brevicompactum TaxID=5074 RepID=UPI0025421A7A|nr:uncharacterized protein N7506_011543 [Penicillium brevicompactum]KAJ5318839.1 hypothetical protein N7506_011543 [Penicillium brevicompactum]
METELERRGNLKELQQHRFERFYKFFQYYEKDPFSTLLNIETSLRETFQREVTLKQELIKAKTDNKEHGDSYYRAITKKLDELNQKYWLLERDCEAVSLRVLGREDSAYGDRIPDGICIVFSMTTVRVKEAAVAENVGAARAAKWFQLADLESDTARSNVDAV